MNEGTINYPPYSIAWANTQSRIFRSFPFQSREQAIEWAKVKATSHFNVSNQTVYLVTPDHQFHPLTASDLGNQLFRDQQQQNTPDDDDDDWETDTGVWLGDDDDDDDDNDGEHD